MEIPVAIRNRRADAGHAAIVCGNSDYTVRFDFDGEWDVSSPKTARFRFRKDGQECCIDVPFTGDRCAVPVLSGIDLVALGVWTDALRTSAPARIPCVSCISDLEGTRTQPSRSLICRILQQLAEIRGGFAGRFCALADSGGDFICTADGAYIICKE